MKLINHIGTLITLMCLLLPALPAQAQQGSVSGKVTENGEPLPGVTVAVKGTTVAVATDLDGAYSIAVPGPNATLVFSFLGFTTQEILVGSRSTIDVVMKENIRQIEEVVVVGYGTQKRESVVAAISSMSAVALKQTPAANLGIALAGRLPGLTVMQRTGQPGAERMEFYIRGRGTTNGSSPLVLVDGMEREFTTIDPHEVESITVLKDASATAVYGVRGANGVIIVTTRRGQAGQAKIDVTIEQAWQAPTRIPEMVSAYDYALLRNQLDIADGRAASYSDYALERYRLGDQTDLYPVRNFAKEFMHTAAPLQHVNVNVSGGTEKMRYFTAVGYLHQLGLFKTEKFDEYDYDPASKSDRVNFRSNVDVNLTRNLTMFLNISGDMTKKNESAGGGDGYSSIMNSILATPNNAHNDLTPDGEVLVNRSNTNSGPYGMLNRTGFSNTQMNRVASSLGAEQKLDFITQGLSIKAVVSYDFITHNNQSRSRTYQEYEAIEDPMAPGEVTYRKVGDHENSTLHDGQAKLFHQFFNVDASVNYARTFGDDHAVTAMALFNRYQKTIEIELPYNYIGYVGRITYAYKNRYLAEFNFGYNGSEQFAPGHKMGFFPSLSAGWVLSEEAFMQQAAPWLTFAKLRASFGQVGSDQMGGRRFAFLTLWSGSNEAQIGNPSLEWEKANKYNLGLDLRLFNDITLEGDIFYERRNNILINGDAYVPNGMFGTGDIDNGSMLPRINAGEVENKGFEFVAGYQKSFTPDTRLDLMFNVAYSRNKVLDMQEVYLPETYAYRLRGTGFRLGEQWGFETAGLFNTEQELLDWYDQTPLLGGAPKLGDLKYKDQNGDGVISIEDIVPMGNPDVPEWNFGFGVSFQFKGFDVSMTWQAVAGRSHMMTPEAFSEILNFNVWHKEAWSPERYAAGEPITYPRLALTTEKFHGSDFWLLNASYLRLKNAELGYTLPKKISSKIGATALRVYVNGLNLLTFDHIPHHLWDPEQNGNRLYPLFRTYNIGLNISF